MDRKPIYEELEQRIKELEQEAVLRKLAEQALRESEERYRTIFELAADSIVLIDGERGELVEFNKRAHESLGFTHEEFEKLKIPDFEIIEDTEEVAKHIKKIIKEGFDSFETKHRTKSGEIRDIQVSSRGISIRGKNFVQSIWRDITEHKRAEEALGESRKRYKQLWDDAPVAYHVLDTKGIIKQVNQTEIDMLGYTKDEMVDESIFKFVVPEQRKEAEERFRLKLAGKRLPKQDDRIYVKKDGSKMYVSIDDVLEHDSNGKIIGIRTTMVDISEQKRAEEALRQSEQKYSALVENSLTGIYVDQDEKIVFANNRFVEIYRYPREELIGIETWRLVHPEDRGLTSEIRAKRLTGEDAPLEYEARGLTKDGETIWITRRNALIEYKGRPVILGNVVDITEKKRAEEELRKTNEELKNFVHVVSHDLKTPIIAVQGFSSRLLKKYQEKLDEKARSYLEQIQSSARRMELFVSDLLSLARIGQVASTFNDVSSFGIVKDVVSRLQPRQKDKEIKLDVVDILPTIWCDGERMSQVFENLLVNAMKFMGDSENPKIEIGYEDRGDFHQFYVKDNGIGIDPKYQQTIFDMFQQVKEIKDKEGTGIGLAIVDRIVKSHGGEVWVDSEKAKGATFYFTLPKASRPRTPP